jgi:N-acetylmuramoyl-L-alanine amidase
VGRCTRIFKILFFLSIFLLIRPESVCAADQSSYLELPIKTDVSNYKVWTVNFNLPVKSESINNNNITVVDSNNSTVKVNVMPGTDGKSAIVIPEPGGYKPGQTYYLNVDKKVESKSGSGMASLTKMKFVVSSSISGLSADEFLNKSKSIVTINTYDLNRQLINTGKGFVISADGQVVTNLSVVDGATYVECITHDNRTFIFSGVFNYDIADDLAILKLDNPYNLNYINIGDSTKLKINDQVISVFNPTNLKSDILNGIVREVNNTSEEQYILTSGIKSKIGDSGMLLNAQGELVAIMVDGFVDGKEESIGIPSKKVSNLTSSANFKTFDTLFSEMYPILGLDLDNNSNNNMRKVVLDPGHGGSDRVNKGPTGYVEADGVLDIALKTREILKAYPNIQVFMTRENDQTLNSTDRVAKSNSFGAEILVSIHSNAGPANADGAEAFYSIKSPIGEKGYKLSRLVLQNLVNYTGVDSRGAKTRAGTVNPSQDYYFMIRDTKPISTIIEAAFHTNPYEEQLLKSEEFRYKSALGIAKGIVEYFGFQWKEPQSQTPAGTTTYKVYVDGVFRAEYMSKENALNLAGLMYEQTYSKKVNVTSSTGEAIFSKDKTIIVNSTNVLTDLNTSGNIIPVQN